jgi:hypothetical protein
MFASQGEHAAPRPLNREIARVPPLQLLQLVLAEEREKQGIPLLQLLRLRFGVFLWVGARHYMITCDCASSLRSWWSALFLMLG